MSITIRTETTTAVPLRSFHDVRAYLVAQQRQQAWFIDPMDEYTVFCMNVFGSVVVLYNSCFNFPLLLFSDKNWQIFSPENAAPDESYVVLERDDEVSIVMSLATHQWSNK